MKRALPIFPFCSRSPPPAAAEGAAPPAGGLCDGLSVETCERKRAHSLILKLQERIPRLDLERLEFYEVIHRTLLLHLSSGTVLERAGGLNELSRRLAPCGCFLRPTAPA